ncbi:hypothetical protein CFFPNG_04540 [Methylorubrum aminovorans]
MDAIQEKYGLSERHACRIVGQHRGTQRYVLSVPADEDALTRAIIALASEYGRYGYRRVTALLQAAGWQVGKDRVQRIWHGEGLMLRGQCAETIQDWLSSAGLSALRRFAAGLPRDAGITNAIALPWSMGPLEGQIGRL